MNRYPSRLHHRTPPWVDSGATFHIRISIPLGASITLTNPDIAIRMLASARHYHEHERWHCQLFLLMHDHLHALLVFPYNQPMDLVIAAWKGYQSKYLNVTWQSNFFDHRIRNREEFQETERYIRHNPVRRGLCVDPEAWPWVISCV